MSGPPNADSDSEFCRNSRLTQQNRFKYQEFSNEKATRNELSFIKPIKMSSG